MRVLTKENLSFIVRWVMEAVFASGVLILISLQGFLARFYMWYFGGRNMFFYSMLALLYFSGLNGLAIIRMVIGLFNDIHLKAPFVPKNAKRLKCISACCFAVGAAFLAHCLFYRSVFRAAVTFIIFVAAMACYALGQLFQEAVDHKAENDLTV